MMLEHMILGSAHEHCVDIKNRTVFLHGAGIDEDAGVNWRMSNRFLKNMHILDLKPDRIIIHQQNIGGEIPSGMMIYDIIANSESHSTMICHGEVMSMGTIILQAADLRLSMPNCIFMMHYGESHAEGIWKSVESQIKFEKASCAHAMNIYAEKCVNGSFFTEKEYTKSQTKSYIASKFKNEVDWYLTAHQAKEYGFIDGIIGEDYSIKDL